MDVVEIDRSRPADAPGQPSPPTGSALQRLVGVFVNPRATFEAMATKPRFLAALLVVTVAQIIFAVAIFQSGAVRSDSIAKMEAKGAPPEQIAGMEQFFDSPAAGVIGAVTAAVSVTFILLFSAALLFFMANLMLGARLTYRHYLSAAAYSSVIGIVDLVVRALLGVSRGTLDVRLGLGNLMGEELGFFGRVLDTLTDPLYLWSMSILALGVSVYAKKSFSFGALAVLPVLLISVLLSGMR